MLSLSLVLGTKHRQLHQLLPLRVALEATLSHWSTVPLPVVSTNTAHGCFNQPELAGLAQLFHGQLTTRPLLMLAVYPTQAKQHQYWIK